MVDGAPPTGLAPRIVLVRQWLDGRRRPADADAPTMQDRQALLVRFGVPADAITVASDVACMTSDELDIAARTLSNSPLPVILVTSKYHTRRVSVLWRSTGQSVPRAIIRTPAADPFAPSSWWYDRRFVVRVAREYVGLVSARLPLPRPEPPCSNAYIQAVRLFDWLDG